MYRDWFRIKEISAEWILENTKTRLKETKTDLIWECFDLNKKTMEYEFLGILKQKRKSNHWYCNYNLMSWNTFDFLCYDPKPKKRGEK